MKGMSFLPSLGLGRCQHGPNEFVDAINYDTPFRLRYIPTKVDYQYMA